MAIQGIRMILGMMKIMTKMRVFNDDNDNDKDDDNDDAKFARRQPDLATPSSHLSSTHLLVILMMMMVVMMILMMMMMMTWLLHHHTCLPITSWLFS